MGVVLDFGLGRHFHSSAVTESASPPNGRCEDFTVRYSRLAIATVALLAAWQLVSSRPIHRDPGEVAGEEPLQLDLEEPWTGTRGDFQVIAQARFSAEV